MPSRVSTLGCRVRAELRASVERTREEWLDLDIADPLDYSLARWGWPVRVAPMLDVCPALGNLPPWQLMLAEALTCKGTVLVLLLCSNCQRSFYQRQRLPTSQR